MIIGIDFDNTIVCYDRVFHRVATERGLVPAEVPATKEHVRDYLRGCNCEKVWTELQGYVYAKGILGAEAFPGVFSFFQHARDLGIATFIVSHKTRHPFEGPKDDLHVAARSWLAGAGFFDNERIGLSSDRVYFEPTKQRKLERIAELGCNVFIDDLPEFLVEPAFPQGVTKMLFDPWGLHAGIEGIDACTSWEGISERLFGVEATAA